MNQGISTEAGSSLLKDHYEKKYSHELEGGECLFIQSKKFPLNRSEAALKFLPAHFRGGKVLELGAGDGNVAFNLLREIPGISHYALGDLSLTRVKGIQRKLNDPRLSALELNAESIPDEEHGKYDAVIMIALIEHLVDPLRAMQNIRKLLRPGGFVYIDTPNIAKYTRRLKLLLGQFPSTASQNEGLTTYHGQPVDLHDEGHLHYFTYRSLTQMLLTRCDFQSVKKLGYHVGQLPIGPIVPGVLAQVWPAMFSELALLAYV